MSSTADDGAESNREKRVAFLARKWGIPRDEAERLLDDAGDP
jgi:hypothetical protein